MIVFIQNGPKVIWFKFNTGNFSCLVMKQNKWIDTFNPFCVITLCHSLHMFVWCGAKPLLMYFLKLVLKYTISTANGTNGTF